MQNSFSTTDRHFLIIGYKPMLEFW